MIPSFIIKKAERFQGLLSNPVSQNKCKKSCVTTWKIWHTICKKQPTQHTNITTACCYHLLSRTKLRHLHTSNQDTNYSRPSVCHHTVPRGWRCVLPLKETFPKQIFPIVKTQGSFFITPVEHIQKHRPSVPLCQSVWTIWTEELAESISMLSAIAPSLMWL